MLRFGVKAPPPSTLWMARNPTFALSITADCYIHAAGISYVDRDSIGEPYGGNGSHPVILQVPDKASPAIVVDLSVNPDTADLLEIDWRGEEKHPCQNGEDEGAFSVPIFIDTSVRIELGITLSVETHEALST